MYMVLPLAYSCCMYDQMSLVLYTCVYQRQILIKYLQINIVIVPCNQHAEQIAIIRRFIKDVL